jgi:hypothetical protein
MNTRSVENRGSLSSYRQSLRPAMKGIFTTAFSSALMARGPLWPGPQRWTLEYVLYVSLLMVLDGSETLKDRFAHARQTVVEMFPNRKRPGKTYQGHVKACRRLRRGQLRAIHDQRRCRHRRLAGPYWQRDGWVVCAADGTRGHASGRPVWPSRRPGDLTATGGRGPLRTPGIEVGAELAPQEERPPAGGTKDPRGHPRGKAPCPKDLRKHRSPLSSRRWVPCLRLVSMSCLSRGTCLRGASLAPGAGYCICNPLRRACPERQRTGRASRSPEDVVWSLP